MFFPTDKVTSVDIINSLNNQTVIALFVEKMCIDSTTPQIAEDHQKSGLSLHEQS
ncbi:hypothetical protein MTBBW1_1380061 [Desulfamplus magnetovallimortis]|uniref:Uncharacterized protein n=1 Tax=Desulfamplus magnetovallimortis TaxID=1246637 RepID=A0A1W1H7V1_9BACT|nr:hypothetical protein MTBBW1_1380061 [Desulfamplus magnetovallimortis]